ncbi:DUF1259 domain-containing protein [Streptomyces cynarae]|uniref:DUF1259 domain-containing protein n=1 Tax=Streptomyces cynarae TaxID=2981134 RepID=A0ABY6E459_9ACTN|nr:DUF1259 domain-containing protein [Streptomyces cynarae]UXY20708.1 DUF1259 domain-containing protein [Streptomyces cynarae]
MATEARPGKAGRGAGASRRYLLTTVALGSAFAALPGRAVDAERGASGGGEHGGTDHDRSGERAGPDRRAGRDAGGLVRPVESTTKDWAHVAAELGREGNMLGRLIYRTAFPRTDLRVVSHGVTVSPELAVGSHVSFIRYADNTMMTMGELAVTETELHRVTGALQSHGIEQVAIHNHLLAHSPRLVWIHTHGHGPDAATLARGLRAALACTGTPPAKSSTTRPKKLKLDTAGIDAALGTTGTVYGGVYKAAFLRRETITGGGYILPPGSGATSALSFQPVGGGRAAVSGDVAVVAGEAQKVLDALQRGGIRVVELHNHGMVDTPRMFFIHVWAVDDAVAIARALRRAVDATNSAPARGAGGVE